MFFSLAAESFSSLLALFSLTAGLVLLLLFGLEDFLFFLVFCFVFGICVYPCLVRRRAPGDSYFLVGIVSGPILSRLYHISSRL